MAHMGTAIDVVGAPAIVLGGLLLWLINWYFHERRRKGSQLPLVPEVPGLPMIGNALQLREKKPHMTFLKWAKTYGPIFSIKVGSKSIIVLNKEDVAKEAMVTKFSSISTRKISKGLASVTFDKCMVSMADYGDFHKTMKRHIIKNVLGPTAQKLHRVHRDTVIANLVKDLHTHVKNNGLRPVNFRNIFSSELFGLGLKQAFGRDVEYINVGDLGRLSRREIFRILMIDPIEIALEYLDWSEFFPFLKWFPKSNFEKKKIEKMEFRRLAVMKALIKEQSRQIACGEEMNCYLQYLLTEGEKLTEKEITGLLWEVVIQSSDTAMVTAEWALFELAKNQKLQERLFEEIQSVCWSDKLTEENLCQVPLLDAVLHETLRTHSLLPMLPPRYIHEDTELGGYYIPAGCEVAINLYGCNMDENRWEKPEEWNPERFLDKKKYAPNDAHKTMAFGAGKRLCPGSLQVTLVVCTTVGRLVQEFEWRLEEGEEEKVDIVGIVNQKLNPMHAVIRPRNRRSR